MIARLASIRGLMKGDRGADRVVPPSGFTVRLTLLTSVAMAFLTIFALALSLAAGRLATSWGDELARASTVRISAPEGQMAEQVAAVLTVLEQTPGVASARALTADEQRALLEPWFGPALPVEQLPVPQLVEVLETGDGYDSDGLRLRLQAEAPGAVLDEHSRWRKPLVAAASRLRLLGWTSILLIGGPRGAGRQRTGHRRPAAGGCHRPLHRSGLRPAVHPAHADRRRGGDGAGDAGACADARRR